MNTNVSYCGLKIVDNSKLISIVDNNEDFNGWKRYAHHVTIKLGELPTELRSLKGKRLPITVTHLGQLDGKVVAVKVKVGVKTSNAFAHITLAVNQNSGAKPYDSNKITEWFLIRKFDVVGIVSEFDNHGNSI